MWKRRLIIGAVLIVVGFGARLLLPSHPVSPATPEGVIAISLFIVRMTGFAFVGLGLRSYFRARA